MNRAQTQRYLVGSLLGSAALTCALSAPLHAQEFDQSAEAAEDTAGKSAEQPERVVITTPHRIIRQPSLAPEPGIDTVMRHDHACVPGAIERLGPASSLGCAFEDTTLGFSAREQLGLADVLLAIETSSARSTSGAFAIDHARRGFERGMNVESTLSKLAIDARLFDGRIEWQSSVSWTQQWETPVADAPILPIRMAEVNGSASEHRFKLKLLDSKAVDWTLEGKLTHADEDYRPFFAVVPDRLFAAQGDQARLNTRLQVSDWRIDAGFSSLENGYFVSESQSLAVSRSGVTLRFTRADGKSDGNLAELEGVRRESRRRVFGLDLNAFELLPQLALQDTGWAGLIPKTLTLEATQRDAERFDTGPASYISNTSFSVFGLWLTSLGDTVINYRTERETGLRLSGGLHEGSSDFLMVSQGMRFGDWRISADYVKSSDKQGGGLILSSGSGMATTGIGVRYTKKDMPQIDFRLGRDNLDFTGGDGALTIQDRSLRARMEVDFSPLLSKQLRRDDMHLKLDMLWDFDESGYEFRLFDEVIDRDFSTRTGRGVMFNFTMKLN